MKPIEFPADATIDMTLYEATAKWPCIPPLYERVTFGAEQSEYLPLPALRLRNENGQVVSRWRLTWLERLHVFLSGQMFVSQLTFGENLQPIRPSADLREALS